MGLGLRLPISAAGATHIALMLHDFGHKAMASRSVGQQPARRCGRTGRRLERVGRVEPLVVQRGVTELVGR